MATPKNTKPKKTESPSQDNHLPASLAHFSILAVFIIGPFSMAIPLIIWLLER